MQAIANEALEETKAERAKPRKRRAPNSPGMRSCVKCGRIYPARALVTPANNNKVRICGTDALKIAKKQPDMRLSRLKVVARKARLYDRKMCR